MAASGWHSKCCRILHALRSGSGRATRGTATSRYVTTHSIQRVSSVLTSSPRNGDGRFKDWLHPVRERALVGLELARVVQALAERELAPAGWPSHSWPGRRATRCITFRRSPGFTRRRTE